jgi:DNA-directed RNA polymerase subunit RPC12/RpoP
MGGERVSSWGAKTAVQCVCSRCGHEFELLTEGGGSIICSACAGIMLAFIYGEISQAAMERRLRTRKQAMNEFKEKQIDQELSG